MPLLSLPAELRTKIYRLAIIEPNEIQIRAIDRPPIEPRLLCFCRQVRDEVSEIYYHENQFRFHFEHLDASKYFEWCRKSVVRASVDVKFANTKGMAWPCLKTWLKAYY